MAKETKGKDAVKGKAVKSTSQPEQEPIVEEVTKKYIHGREIISVTELASGHFHVIDSDRTGYTLPKSEYELL